MKKKSLELAILYLVFIFCKPLPVLAQDTSSPNFDSVSISDVTSSSVKISITTDEATTISISYGTTEDMTSSKSDTNLSTSHSITLDSLSANTTYYYNIEATDASSNTAGRGMETFTTASSSSSSSTTTTVTKIVTPTFTPTPTPDIVPPTVRITTNVEKPFTISPLIEGTASDVSGVVSAAFTLDDGKTWSTISDIKGSTSVRFSFTPPPLDDGSYPLKARATDGFGNTGLSKAVTLTIDRLPPRIGTTIITYGPQVLTPDPSGTIYAIAGLPYRLTVSAVGGPTTVDLFSTPLGSTFASSPSANLVKNIDSGLWSTSLTPTHPGTFTLSTISMDGAANQSTRQLIAIEVLSAGKVQTTNTQAIENATLKVYFVHPDTNEFLLWDGAPWGLPNPFKSDEKGLYRLVLPEGRYFIEASHPKYHTIRTQLFTLTRSTPIATTFTLGKKPILALGKWELSPPQLFLEEILFTFPSPYSTNNPPALPAGRQPTTHNQILGTEIPAFTFYGGSDSISYVSIRGKPTLLTFLNTFSPTTYEELPILESLSNDEDLGVYVIVPHESARAVEIFRTRGNYQVPIFADPDGDLPEALSINIVPTHLFLDKRGNIKAVKIGVLKEDQLRDNLLR